MTLTEQLLDRFCVITNIMSAEIHLAAANQVPPCHTYKNTMSKNMVKY